MRTVLLLIFPLHLWAQCDLEIVGFNPTSLDVQVGVLDGVGCGSPADSVGEFMLGLTTSPQLDEYSYPCFYADGWALLVLPVGFPLVDMNFDGAYLQTGDTVTFNLVDAFLGGSDASLCWLDAINDGILQECFVLAITQINDSDDITGQTGLGGFAYPDVNIQNNIIDFSTVNPDCGTPPAIVDESTGQEDEPCPEPSVYIPNVFTPNNDGKNDVFRAVTNCDADCWLLWEFTIYNRWGIKVFQSDYPSQQWLGNVAGQHYAPDGVYVWNLKARHRYGQTYQKNGIVTLLK